MMATLFSQFNRLKMNIEKRNVLFFYSYRTVSSATVEYFFSNVRLYRVHGASNVASNVGAD